MEVQLSQLLAQTPEAPTVRATTEQWADPIRFIESLRPLGEEHGIVKIVPPAGSQRPRDRFTGSDAVFDTKRQNVHMLQEGNSFEEVRRDEPQRNCRR